MGTLSASACDAVANAKARVLRVNADDNSRHAVAECGGRFETVPHLLDGRLPPERSAGVQYLPELIGARSGLLQEIHSRLLDFHPFGTGTDDRVCRAHQNSSRGCHGIRHILELE